MKTFQIKVLADKDADQVTTILKNMVLAGVIEINENFENGIAPSFDQVEEMIDESELSPYYTDEQIKNILHL